MKSAAPTRKDEPCPSCGHCPTCGHTPTPPSPYPVYPQPYWYWHQPYQYGTGTPPWPTQIWSSVTTAVN